jgi:hypothetical protein
LHVRWQIGDSAALALYANLGGTPQPLAGKSAGRPIYSTGRAALPPETLQPWSVMWLHDN